MTQLDPVALHRAHLDQRERSPMSRARDLAAQLGVPEAALLAACCGVTGEPIRAERLRMSDVPALLRQMPSLGQLKAITRNETVVLEIEGAYGAVEFFGPMGQSVSSLDLRIFSSRWRHGFVVTEDTKRGERTSLQFFDAHGDAVHKLYVLPATDRAALDRLRQEFRSDDPSAALDAEPRPAREPERADADIDVPGLRAAWEAMRDTHEFFGLLRRFQVTRTQALRLVGTDLAQPVPVGSFERLLHDVAASGLPFMLFVGNPGIIQIHTGPVKRVVVMDEWLNVLDPEMNLHVRSNEVASAWLVRKPTADGIVTAVEFYDRDGEQVALFTGKRKPGTPEQTAWREQAERMTQNV